MTVDSRRRRPDPGPPRGAPRWGSPRPPPRRAGRACDGAPAEGERLARPERMAVGAEADPDPGRAWTAPSDERGLGPNEILGHGHLEVHRISGNGMDGG